jgi:hypothetical protein
VRGRMEADGVRVRRGGGVNGDGGLISQELFSFHIPVRGGAGRWGREGRGRRREEGGGGREGRVGSRRVNMLWEWRGSGCWEWWRCGGGGGEGIEFEFHDVIP